MVLAAESARPDRDKNFFRHLSETGNAHRRGRSQYRRNSRRARALADCMLRSEARRLRGQHQLLALLAPKHENAFPFRQLLLRRWGSGALPDEVFALSSTSVVKMRAWRNEATKEQRLPYLLSATGALFTSSLEGSAPGIEFPVNEH